MVRISRNIPAAACAAALALFVAGCASPGDGTATLGAPLLSRVGGIEKPNITVAVSPVLDSAGFYVALRDGLFKEVGLNVNYLPARGDTVIGNQEKGQYDITATNYVSYVEAQVSREADLDIIAEASLLGPGDRVIMTLPGSDIHSLKDLRGHILGVNPDINIGFLLAASVLSENGLAFKQDAGPGSGYVAFPHKFDMPFPDASPVLVSRQAPAVVMSEPFASQLAMAHGATVLADLNSGATEQFPIQGYAVTKAWARANPNTLKAFVTALRVGQQISDTNRAAVESAFVAELRAPFQVDRRTAAVMALNSYPLSIDPTRLQRVADFMFRFRFIAKPFNINTMLTDQG